MLGINAINYYATIRCSDFYGYYLLYVVAFDSELINQLRVLVYRRLELNRTDVSQKFRDSLSSEQV